MSLAPRARQVLQGTAVVLAAALTGALATKPLLVYLMDQRALRNGPWRTSIHTGSAAANPYERAAVALAGLYALTPAEAVYFTAFTDSAGQTLRGECQYIVRGTPPPARWWSLTAYGADHYLVPNAAGVHARHASNLPATADGRFEIALAAQPNTANGLPIPAMGVFSLTLRLYNPNAAVRAQLKTLALPTITAEGCP